MTNEPSGLPLQMPFAVFDRDMSRWRTCQPSLELGNLPEQSVTWPRSGMTHNGNAYERPMSVPLTAGSGVSSLLPTPEAKLSNSGPDYARMSRPGSGGHDLTTAVALLPTPSAADGNGGGRFNSTGHQSTLPGTARLIGEATDLQSGSGKGALAGPPLIQPSPREPAHGDCHLF